MIGHNNNLLENRKNKKGMQQNQNSNKINDTKYMREIKIIVTTKDAS